MLFLFYDVDLNKVTIWTYYFVNDSCVLLKEFAYHPILLGETKRDFVNIDEDLNLMIEAGINTIRLYEPVDDINVMNKISSAGIKLIIGFGYDQNGIYDIKSGTFIDYVKKYRIMNQF